MQNLLRGADLNSVTQPEVRRRLKEFFGSNPLTAIELDHNETSSSYSFDTPFNNVVEPNPNTDHQSYKYLCQSQQFRT